VREKGGEREGRESNMRGKHEEEEDGDRSIVRMGSGKGGRGRRGTNEQ
jgi:hypothetical protein